MQSLINRTRSIILILFAMSLCIFATDMNAQSNRVQVIIPAYSNVTKREVPFAVDGYDMSDTTKIKTYVSYNSQIGYYIYLNAGKSYILSIKAQT